MAKVWFKTFGCPTNFSESEAMIGLLQKAGFELAKSIDEAYVIVLNICTVKGNTTALREIRNAVKDYPNKKLIIAGCITSDIIPEIREITEDASLIGTHNIKDIVSVAEETINDNPINAIIPPENPDIKVSLPKIRQKPSIAIVPICSGCNGKCTYCSVRIVKGKLFSYPMEAIIEECHRAVTRGCKEIWITSQDTASYMVDREKKSRLPELVKRVAKIPGDFKIRVGMMNVNTIRPVIDDMIEAFKMEKVFKFLHLPAQSGNDEILRKMGRGYSTRQFKNTIMQFRDFIPDITISTDIICGFPGEAKDQFKDSVKLIEEIEPDVLNVSKFRSRPGTEAAEMKERVDGEEVKRRSKMITSAFEWTAYKKNKEWLGKAGDIIIDEQGKEGTNTIVGRNYAYRPVVVDNPGKKLKIGDTVKVKIIGYSKHDLRGELI